MVKLKELRKSAITRLECCENDSPLADIDYILLNMGFSKTDLVLGEKSVDDTALASFEQSLLRLIAGEPVQYIVGHCEFMSMKFEVTPATLIPRSDTEVLVEEVIALCKRIQNPIIFEIGSGSGCIAISLAKALPDAKIISADISKSALEVSRRNSKINGTDDSVTFIEHNILSGFPVFDALPQVIVSNPPYIPSTDISGLARKVKEFEPLSALDGGKDGLDFYRFIIDNASLKTGGFLAFEVGIGQAQEVALLMNERFCNVKIIRDLAAIERVVIGQIR